MCLVLGAGETEMNEPQRLALGLMGCGGGGADRQRTTVYKAKWEHRGSGGHLTQPGGIAESFPVEAMTKWGLEGQVGIS